MYRAIIVEDELLFRVAYQSIVDWGKFGFELVGIFENGQAALDAFDEIRPDFVLTDTKMPLCDGITMIREIKKRSPDTVCIILSAYGDLDYVKDSIRFGADDYLLKLDLTREKMASLLMNVTKKLKETRKSEIESVPHDRQKGRDRFLLSWIRGEYSEQETIQDYLKFYGIKFYSDHLVCMSIHIDELDGGICKTPSESISFAIKQTIWETLCSTGVWLLIDMRANMFYSIGCCDSINPIVFGEHMKKSVLFALKSVMNLSKVTVHIGIANSVTDVSSTFNRICTEDMESNIDTMSKEIAAEAEKLVGYILSFSYSQSTESLRKLNQLFSIATGLPIETMRNHCSCILMVLSAAMNKDPLLEKHFYNLYPQLKADLRNCYFPREVSNWIDRLCAHMEKMEMTRAPAASLASRAADYIQAHYSEDLSLDLIAAQIKVSSTYLSHIFSQEQGIGVQEYLTNQRIQHAKQLLTETDYKVYEIANMVGYSNAVYFNKVFKKQTGKTPKEYRILK